MKDCMCPEHASGTATGAHPLQSGKRKASRLLPRFDARAIADSLEHTRTLIAKGHNNAGAAGANLGTHCGIDPQLPCLGRHRGVHHVSWYDTSGGIGKRPDDS